MQFINEQNDFTFALFDFIQNGFQTFFKFTSEFCASNEGAHIQRENGFVFQTVGNIFFDNTLCKTFRDGCFTDTGFTDEHRVIFGFSGQNTDDVTDFIVTANNWIQFFASCFFHQVSAVFLQSIISCFGRIAGHTSIAPYCCQDFHKAFFGDVILTENIFQCRIGTVYHCHENMFYGYIFVSHVFCQLFCCCQCFFQVRRNICLSARCSWQFFHFIFRCLKQTVYIHIHFLHQLRDQTFILRQQCHQQMLLIHLGVSIFHCHRLGVLNGLQRFLCKFL